MKITTDPQYDQDLRVEAARRNWSASQLVNELLGRELPKLKAQQVPASKAGTAGESEDAGL